MNMTSLLLGLCLKVSGTGFDQSEMGRWVSSPTTGQIVAQKLNQPLLVVCSPLSSTYDPSAWSLFDPESGVRAARYARFLVRNQHELSKFDPRLVFPKLSSLVVFDRNHHLLGTLTDLPWPATVTSFLDRCFEIDRMVNGDEGSTVDTNIIAALNGNSNVKGVTANCILADRYRFESKWREALTYADRAASQATTINEQFEAAIRKCTALMRLNRELEATTIAKRLYLDPNLTAFNKYALNRIGSIRGPRRRLRSR